MNSDEISQKISDKHNDILTASDNLNTVLEAVYKTKKELVELTEAARKGKHVLSKLRVEAQILERSYWASKGR